MRFESIAVRLLRWAEGHGRHDLPWQHPRTAYRVWVSEVMLQQTQVVTVIQYFAHFVKRFPTLRKLAAAPLDDVLAEWSGLGYYSRARNLHRAAQICVAEHGGKLPRKFDALMALPGIGRSTAGAILAQAYGLRYPILDGNVKRVLARFHGIPGLPQAAATENKLWKLAEKHTPHERLAEYTQAIMDLGATVCLRVGARCPFCPLARKCVAYKSGQVLQLPEPRAPHPLPARSVVMLLLRDGEGRVLLERRPPTGVWPLLWSLPEFKHMAEVRHMAGVESVASFRLLEPFVHYFSHFRLHVTPFVGTIDQAPRHIEDNPKQRWVQVAQALRLGLPAPIRKLIKTVVEES